MVGKGMGSAVVWVAVAALIALYAAWLTVQFDAATERAAAAQVRERQLVASLQQLAGRATPPQPAPAPAALTVALLRQPQLIPFEPQVGGRFYFLEDTLQVLSDRYLYVTCEDGHVRCHMLLAYERDGDEVAFRVVDAYLQ